MRSASLVLASSGLRRASSARVSSAASWSSFSRIRSSDAGADAAAAGEDRLAALRQALDEGEELVALVLGKGFEVVEDEQRLRGAQRIEQEPDALVLRRLRDVRLAQLAGELIEHLEEPRQEEAAELAHAVVVQLAVLHGDEDDALELAGRAVVGGADGERGLAHAARAIDERAPGARLGIEGFANRFQFLFAPEEGLEAGKVVRDGGAGPLVAVLGSGLVMLLGKPLVQGEAFEDEVGDLLGRFVVELDKSGGVKESSDLCILEPGEHDLASFLLGELRVDSHPLPAGPLLFIVIGAKHNDDEVGLIAVELWQIDAQIVAGEFGFVELVVQDRRFAEALRENDRDLRDIVSLFPAKENAMRKRLALISADIAVCIVAPAVLSLHAPASTRSSRSLFPTTEAARCSVPRVTEALSGSRRRSRADRLVPIWRAIAALLRPCCFMACSTCRAMTRLIAVLVHSSRMSSSSRKSSNEDPI